MPYHSLHVQDFRSYADFMVELGDTVNIIVGPNGSGKTNLLEALYVLSTGSSFRVADKDLIRHDTSLWRLESDHEGAKRVVAYDANLSKQQKQFTLDGVKRLRLGHDHKLPVVLFEPEHLRLLHGSPARRREYLDSLLARLQPDYSRLRSRFERVLQQRNNILKDAHTHQVSANKLDDQLFAWDISFADLAEAIVERRRGLIAYLNQGLPGTYSNIAKHASTVIMDYESTLAVGDYKALLLAWLQANRAQDIRRGYSGAGPHRDNFVMLLDGVDASLSASRGEIRTLVLALKMLETELFASRSNHPPLLLFDDVFSELDHERRSQLAQLAQRYQTVITTTDADSVGEFKKHAVHKIVLG